MAYDVGGGGSPTPPSETENAKAALSKPYDLSGPLTPEKVSQLDAMLQELYASAGKTEDLAIETAAEVAGLEPGEESVLRVVEYDITEAELEAANGTPIVLVAAPGADRVAVVSALLIRTTTSVAYSSAPNWQLRYNGVATDLVAVVSAGLTGTTVRTGVSYPSGLQINHVGELKNRAVELSLSAAPGTPATGIATAKARLWYTIVDL